MNRLAGEPSAYLRQHAGNPVDWQPFDDAAFAEARERNVPVFLSVGYAACHWCHVMAGESFEDPAIGAYLREHFVAIKVDREERPDVDDAYMAATQALSGQGGWPMSVFLTPSGQAFFAGTYFPPQPVSGRPSFRQVLEAVVEAWTQRPEEVLATAGAVAAALADPVWRIRTDGAAADGVAAPPGGAASPHGADSGSAAVTGGGVSLEAPAVSDWARSLFVSAVGAVNAMADAEDRTHGGLGTAPKFPPTPGLEFLIRHAAGEGDSSRSAFGLAGRTLGAMVNSALFDQVGGGFARYSVTADWAQPHYEKMLYDNAGLLRILVHWVRLAEARPEALESLYAAGPAGPVHHIHDTTRPVPLSLADARRAAEGTVGWLTEELLLPSGAFASSLDADTVIDGVHHEGLSYHWTRRQLQRAGGGDGAEAVSVVAHLMGIPVAGAAPLHPGRALAQDERAAWERLLPGLREQRAARVMPARDDKVVASWNGMLLAALAEAAMVLGKPDWLVHAVGLGEYLRRVHWDGEVLRRVSHEGRARGIEGLLEDYAACADGYFALYAATGDGQWFDFAAELLTAAQRFVQDGTVFNSAGGSAAVGGAPAGARYADPFDNATAGPVALLAGSLVTFAAYTGSTERRVLAENLLGTLPDLARRAPRSAGGLLSVAQAMTAGPVETAIVGAPGPGRDALARRAWAAPSPGMVIAVWDGMGAAPLPLLEGRSLKDDAGTDVPPLAYVCRNMVCARPVTTVGELGRLL
ncbi:thioredoxin domain-containing protein [Arthrobacter livingstonensis]|uniref:Thioredoxin domain-containing protein n=1 Tax=Arthrobacter livingstonensis TaxID=670078 RepID=A0A2V5LAB8_9MICC|nr:thioredoxin domain-containing protein [Arthrobacter livingstonensis]PYI68429.1 thioredoxin domain-containing protein [Arthrobacter livingstonensis]